MLARLDATTPTHVIDKLRPHILVAHAANRCLSDPLLAATLTLSLRWIDRRVV